ncbi:hypothetical protein [Gordoniibacillus kamchatkensis]|uniref:hypothetical protein n=1 Tax=Gordoniibacillus kamchatkensis TaxID=1590651 RepID=UPI0012E081A0|nr:hypothetical protein [Paenibacillus sp. VKM B-2647]
MTTRGSEAHSAPSMPAPDAVWVQTDEAEGWTEMTRSGDVWEVAGAAVTVAPGEAGTAVALEAPGASVRRVKLRWRQQLGAGVRILNDHWERSYGDLEWRGIVPERVLPWYWLAYDGVRTDGYGVRTGAVAFCFWQADETGISLWLDVRCGGVGVRLGGRRLEAATIVRRSGAESETPFAAAAALCRMLCDRPLLPAGPVYGGNNWYYAYGDSSHDNIVADAAFMAALSSAPQAPLYGHRRRLAVRA